MAATKAPSKAVIVNINHHVCTLNISATRPAKILLFGKLLKSAIPVQRHKIEKKGAHKEILPVLPIKPQVAKEMITMIHQGKIICNKKEAMIMTINTMILLFGYF